MLRMIQIIFFAIVILTVLRSVIGLLGRLGSQWVSAGSASKQTPPPEGSGGRVPTPLKSCSRCGTYVPQNAGVSAGTQFFCSNSCREAAKAA